MLFPQYFHDFDEVLGYRAVVNMLKMIEAGQACRNADVPVFTSSDTTHCVNKAKKMAYRAKNHLVSNCLLIVSLSFSRYCKKLRRLTQFA